MATTEELQQRADEHLEKALALLEKAKAYLIRCEQMVETAKEVKATSLKLKK